MTPKLWPKVWIVGKFGKDSASLKVVPHDAATAAQLATYLQQAQPQPAKPKPAQGGAK